MTGRCLKTDPFSAICCIDLRNLIDLFIYFSIDLRWAFFFLLCLCDNFTASAVTKARPPVMNRVSTKCCSVADVKCSLLLPVVMRVDRQDTGQNRSRQERKNLSYKAVCHFWSTEEEKVYKKKGNRMIANVLKQDLKQNDC